MKMKRGKLEETQREDGLPAQQETSLNDFGKTSWTDSREEVAGWNSTILTRAKNTTSKVDSDSHQQMIDRPAILKEGQSHAPPTGYL